MLKVLISVFFIYIAVTWALDDTHIVQHSTTKTEATSVAPTVNNLTKLNVNTTLSETGEVKVNQRIYPRKSAESASNNTIVERNSVKNKTDQLVESIKSIENKTESTKNVSNVLETSQSVDNVTAQINIPSKQNNSNNSTVSASKPTTSSNIASSTTTATTTTTTTEPSTVKPKKPLITFSPDDNPLIVETQSIKSNVSSNAGADTKFDEEVANQRNSHPSREFDLDNPSRINERKYIIPFVVLIFVLPMFLGIGIVIVRRVRNYWKTRNYRRMDFLVDGMYNC